MRGSGGYAFAFELLDVPRWRLLSASQCCRVMSLDHQAPRYARHSATSVGQRTEHGLISTESRNIEGGPWVFQVEIHDTAEKLQLAFTAEEKTVAKARTQGLHRFRTRQDRPGGGRRKCGCLTFLISPVAGLVTSTSSHLYQPSTGMRQREVLITWRHIGLVAASSILVLNVKPGGFGCFHRNGIRPHRASAS